MKRWFTLVVMALMAVGANAQELTVSDKHNSGCLRMTRGGEGDEMPIEQIPTIILPTSCLLNCRIIRATVLRLISM